MVTETAQETTIRIKRDTWARLNSRRQRPGESFDDVVRQLLDHEEEREGAGESK